MTGERTIPYTVPYYDEREANAVATVVRSCHVNANGPHGQRCEQRLRERCGSHYALLTTSCTHALELALMVLEVGPGDEVILPSFTFVSGANAALLRGARPVFAEIREDTLNIDPDDIRRKLTRATRVIMPVHYAGVGCDMTAILQIARERGLFVVEDAAQGIDARYGERSLGTLGTIGCYSFHDTKNVSCGEGGALLTQQESLWRKAEIMREKGTNRSAFFRGEVDKYTWVDRGSSYVLSDILAAVLEQQLDKVGEIRERRQAVYDLYTAELQPIAQRGDIVLPVIPPQCTPNYHIFWFRTRTVEDRDRCLSSLKKRGIQATFHYVPLHSSPFARERYGLEPDELPITQRASETLVRLPLYPGLPMEDARYVAQAAKELFG